MASESEDINLEATSILLALPEELRIGYCIKVVKALTETGLKVWGQKGWVNRGKAAKVFLADLQKKRDEILPAVLYTIKPEFREVYLDLLDLIIKEKKRDE